MQAAGFSVSARLRDLLFFNIDFYLFIFAKNQEPILQFRWMEENPNQSANQDTERMCVGVTDGSVGRRKWVCA